MRRLPTCIFSDPHLYRKSRYEVPCHVSVDWFDAVDATEFAVEATTEAVMWNVRAATEEGIP